MRILVLCLMLALASTACAEQAPEHYYNPPENLNTEEGYTPGDFPLGDIYGAQAIYFQEKAALAQTRLDETAKHVSTLGLGEITFASVKNEGPEVLGYFRDYLGVARMQDAGPESMTLLVNINSLDTAVPGRNNRILNLFFNSMRPELGHAVITFNSFASEGGKFSEMQEGQSYSVQANGKILLNGVEKSLFAMLEVTPKSGGWWVETKEPLTLKISDFEFGSGIYDLMKSCNHKSISNDVKIEAQLYLK